jgi:hypothetical protein
MVNSKHTINGKMSYNLEIDLARIGFRTLAYLSAHVTSQGRPCLSSG